MLDELSIYRGKDIVINKNITILQPTLDQIERFGEKKYFNAVYTLTSVGADLKWQLWDMGIDYTQIDDYDLFIKLIYQLVSSKKNIYNELISDREKYKEELSKLSDEQLDDMLVNPLDLIIKDIDLADFKPYEKKDNHQIVLYNSTDDIVIDRLSYSRIVDVVRKMHGFKRNNQIPANETTKMDLIEDARDESMALSNKPYKSVLKPLISSLSVKTGQCGDDRIWNMKICEFFDNIKRISKMQDATMLLQGAYSGFANLKKVDKSRLDWMGDL